MIGHFPVAQVSVLVKSESMWLTQMIFCLPQMEAEMKADLKKVDGKADEEMSGLIPFMQTRRQPRHLRQQLDLECC